MDRLDIGLLCVVATLVLMAMRVPIGISMVGVSFFGLATITSWKAAWGILSSIPYSFLATWELSAVPMFLLMGYIAARAGLTNGLFASMRIIFNWVPGSMASASVAAAAMFSAASGSSVATAAALARIAVPEMLKAGYQKSLATGTIAASGTLGALIPPSILMVIYGVFTNTPIGPLFMAGVIPGILTALAFMLMISIRVLVNPSIAPKAKDVMSAAERRAAFMDFWPLPVLMFGVLGGIMLGVFSPTEAGAVGAALAIAVAAFKRTLTFEMIWNAVVDAAFATAVIFFIAIGAALFQRLLGLSQIPAFVADSLLSISDNKYVIIILIAIIYLVLGMFLESIGLILLTLPVILPLLIELDINLIWFGIITIKLLEIGLMTPPLGMNVYVIKSALGRQVDLITIFKGCGWFIATDLLVLALIVAFPILALYLPSLMK